MERTVEATGSDIDKKVQAIKHVVAQAPKTDPDRWADTAAMLLVDAILNAELLPMETFLDEASRASNNADVDQVRLGTLAAVAHWGVARTLPIVLGRSLDLESAPGKILAYVNEFPGCSSKDIYVSLGIAEATVSRVGAQLEGDGLIYRVRAGKWRRWRVPRSGENTLNAAVLLHDDLEGQPTDSSSGREEVLATLDAQRSSPAPLPEQDRSMPEPAGNRAAFLDRMQARREARSKEPLKE